MNYNKFNSVALLQVIINPNKIIIFLNENIIENYDSILLFYPYRHEDNIKNIIIFMLCLYLLFPKSNYKILNWDKVKTHSNLSANSLSNSVVTNNVFLKYTFPEKKGSLHYKQ